MTLFFWIWYYINLRPHLRQKGGRIKWIFLCKVSLRQEVKRMKSAIFSCLGLGDGLIASVLANNLQLNGSTVTLFHPFLKQLQSWFPSIEISPFPPVEQLSRFDAFFFFYEKTEQMQKILQHCETHYPLQTKVLNPIATLNQDYPYWEMGKF